MRNFLAAAILAVASSVASAAPYIVYSGAISGTNFSISGPAKAATRIFVLTDLANTGNFAVLLVNATGQYSVLARPSDSPTTDEANNNFLGSAGDEAIFSYSGGVAGSYGGTLIRGYGTGPLTTRNTKLVAARTKPLVVALRTNRYSAGSYTFSTTTPAIDSGQLPFAKSITGSAAGYVIDAGGGLSSATAAGAFALALNFDLTGLANIGGAYSPNVSNVSAVLPVAIPVGTSIPDAFAAWLAAFAAANGFVPANYDENGGQYPAYSGGVDIGGTTLALIGTLEARAALVTVGAGTLRVSNGGIVVLGPLPSYGSVGAITLGSSNAFDNVLALGGLTSAISPYNFTGAAYTWTPIPSGTLSVFDPNGTGSSLGFDVDLGTLVLNSATGVFSVTGDGYIDPAEGGSISVVAGNALTQNFTGSLGFSTATLVISAVNPDGTVNGTISSPDGAFSPFLDTSLNFTKATLTANGVTSGFQVNAMYTGTVSLLGGTITDYSGDGEIDFTGNTIAVTTANAGNLPSARASLGTTGSITIGQPAAATRPAR